MAGNVAFDEFGAGCVAPGGEGMTEPVLTVNRLPVTQEARKYPLATQSGIAMFVHVVEACQVWSKCTKPQRALLAELVPPVVDVMLAKGFLSMEDMPLLPGRVSRATIAAMQRRGLVDDQFRLTGCAVHAWFYAGRSKEPQQSGGDAA
jgi:hypothetical protein